MLKANIIGNLGSDPELRYSAQGVAMLTFNVACNYRVRNAEGDWEEKTEWVRARIIGTRAESLGEYLKKGTKVFCDGRLEARPYLSNQNEPRAGLELLVNDVEFMQPGSATDQREAAARTPSQAPASQGAASQGAAPQSQRAPAGVRGYARAPQAAPARPAQQTLPADELEDLPF